MAKARILVVDDSADTANLMATIIREHGLHAIPVYSGQRAIEVAEQLRPSVILLDLDMPEVDGFDVCRKIRMTPWGKSMRIVACTGWSRTADHDSATEAGFDDFLVKPMGIEAVLHAIALQPTPCTG